MDTAVLCAKFQNDWITEKWINGQTKFNGHYSSVTAQHHTQSHIHTHAYVHMHTHTGFT